ncbi:conjugal transfer protein TraF [Balneola sp. MJW-20]|uniref:conjugal transfer protein TraF n=1 Tax=Gracilimonas aurantiaca TaxID=3234185 RepID=UPI0034661ECD
MRTKLRISVLLFGLLFPTFALKAQSGGFAGASTRLGFNANSLARANAMTAVTTEGPLSYFNPALTSLRSDKIPLQLSVGSLQFDRVFQSTAVQFQLPPTAAFSVQIIRTGINDIDGRTVSGYYTDTFSTNEYQINGSFGIRLNERLLAGIGIKFNMADYHSDLDIATAVGLDLGFIWRTTDSFNIGLTVQDLFASYTWNSAELYGLDQNRNVNNYFPTRFTLGLAYEKELFDISADLEVQSLRSEVSESEFDILGGSPVVFSNTDEVRTSAVILRSGGSWRAHERFTLRGGWRIADASDSDSWGMSTGFSLHLPFDLLSPSIDYAFAIEPYRISRIHMFSLRFDL